MQSLKPDRKYHNHEGGLIMNEYMLNAHDVENLLRVKTSKAYGIIRNLNNRLEKSGYMTVRGKVPRKYLYAAFGLEKEQLGEHK